VQSVANKTDNCAGKDRPERRSTVIAGIRRLMREHGVRVEDLLRPNSVVGSGRTEPRRPIYRGPNGELWRSGPGRKPGWVNQILASDGDLSAFEVEGFL